MNRKEAIEFLKQSLRGIPALAKLNYDNSKYPLWRDTITGILEAVFGQNSIEYKEFKRSGRLAHVHTAFDAFTNIHQEDYITNLKGLETAILSIIKKCDILGAEEKPATTDIAPPRSPAEVAIQLFNGLKLHPDIVTASKSLFETQHYAQAIFEAFKAVENFVKQKAGLSLYGKQLMAKVFDEENPLIKVTEGGKFNKEVQEGFKFLFMGATLGIRNPKAHQKVIQRDPFITLEYLAFASFLIKRIEGWEGNLNQ